MNARKNLLAWIDQFENDHYEFDVYGRTISVDLPRKTVEKVMDIALLLVDRVVAAKGDLTTAEYEEHEKNIHKKYPDESEWLHHVILSAVSNDRLFDRYRDIAAMVGELEPHGIPAGSAAYLLMISEDINSVIYAVVRCVDEVEEKYESLAYTFLICILARGWGEAYGWSKTQDGKWTWKSIVTEE